MESWADLSVRIVPIILAIGHNSDSMTGAYHFVRYYTDINVTSPRMSCVTWSPVWHASNHQRMSRFMPSYHEGHLFMGGGGGRTPRFTQSFLFIAQPRVTQYRVPASFNWLGLCSIWLHLDIHHTLLRDHGVPGPHILRNPLTVSSDVIRWNEHWIDVEDASLLRSLMLPRSP